MTVAALDPVALAVPAAHVRGQLVTRLGERPLGWTQLDAPTADELGRGRVGWFVGGHPGFKGALAQLGRLDAVPGGVWVVVPASGNLVGELWVYWPHPAQVYAWPTTARPRWRSRRVWVCSPEHLGGLLPDVRATPGGVAGVIVLDPRCLLHKKARAGTNDRPRHVEAFRAALDADGWQPPLVLLTERRAAAVDAEVVARAYGLDGFRFISGDTFACWEVPIDAD